MRSQLCLVLTIPLMLPLSQAAGLASTPVEPHPPAASLLRAITEEHVAAPMAEQADPNAPDPGYPLEPAKEIKKRRRLAFFRTRTGVTVTIIAGAVVAGALARRSIGN